MKKQLRRRREGKTNYHDRKKLLKSGLPRVIFRRTNSYLISQYIVSKEAQDSVEIGVNSKDLKKYGWPEDFSGSLKSIPAAYLTGFLIGKKIKSQNKKTPIVDFGMITKEHKTKIFSFLKGLIDSGVEIEHKKENVFPDEEKIKGKFLKKDFSKEFDKIKLNIEKMIKKE